MTTVQIRSFAEDRYPPEIRDFLEAHGYQALYHRDLDRALALGTGDGVSPTTRGGAGTVKPARRHKRTNWLGIALRITVLAAALLAGWLILTTVLPKLQRRSEEPNRPEATVVAPPPQALVRAPPASPCLQSMRDGATAWCESALTGSVVRAPKGGSGRDPEPAGCGDRLKVNSDTVRFALNQIFEDEATYTYRHAEVRERCAAAANLAAP